MYEAPAETVYGTRADSKVKAGSSHKEVKPSPLGIQVRLRGIPGIRTALKVSLHARELPRYCCMYPALEDLSYRLK